MSDPTPNPFASPGVAATESIPDHDPNLTIPEFSLGKSLGKWLLICAVSAAPSFFWAFMLPAGVVVRCAAMIAGILSFVCLFVFLESRLWVRRKLLDRTLRKAVRTGFICRVGMSVVFPIAIAIDLWCGLISISIVASVFGNEPHSATHGSAGMFCWFYITTLVQGVVLNVVLGAFTLLVYAVLLIYNARKKISPRVAKADL